MATRSRNQDRVETLQALMDRLCASDLTLAESKELCNRLSGVLSDDSAETTTAPRATRLSLDIFRHLRAVS